MRGLPLPAAQLGSGTRLAHGARSVQPLVAACTWAPGSCAIVPGGFCIALFGAAGVRLAR